jgi:hypothetical protein
MHTEHAAGSFLGEIINRTPKTGQIEVVLMKANNKQIIQGDNDLGKHRATREEIDTDSIV